MMKVISAKPGTSNEEGAGYYDILDVVIEVDGDRLSGRVMATDVALGDDGEPLTEEEARTLYGMRLKRIATLTLTRERAL